VDASYPVSRVTGWSKFNPGRLPAPFSRFDVAIIMFTALVLLGWTFVPSGTGTGIALIVAAVLNAARLARWAGVRTFRDPLVLILHLAYAFVPIGFMLTGLSALTPDTVPLAAGLHAFGVGAAGSMTLSVMVRATLGHTGRELRAGVEGCVVFAMILMAAVRICAAFHPEQLVLLYGSAGAWAIAFLGYAVFFGGMLARPRLKPGEDEGTDCNSAFCDKTYLIREPAAGGTGLFCNEAGASIEVAGILENPDMSRLDRSLSPGCHRSKD
jgi:uncharacterized protein involved in response to NO